MNHGVARFLVAWQIRMMISPCLRIADRTRRCAEGAADLETKRAGSRAPKALIEQLQLLIAKMKRAKFGPRSERKSAAARPVGAGSSRTGNRGAGGGGNGRGGDRSQSFSVRGFTRRRLCATLSPGRSAAPSGSLSSGADVSLLRRHEARRSARTSPKTLDVITAAMVRDGGMCGRSSAAALREISQPPAPFHAIARGFAGPEPAGDDAGGEVRPTISRSTGRADKLRARGDRELSVSTMADHVGSPCAATLGRPLRG